MNIDVRIISIALIIVLEGCSGSASLGGGTNTVSGGANSVTGGANAVGGSSTGVGGHVSVGGQSVNGTGGATTSTYQPCQGKPCGASCTLCAPNDPTCGETAVVKYCTSNGQCTQNAPQCSASSGGATSTGGVATGGALTTGGKPAATGGSGAETQCGSATCVAGEYCCNASCSQCAPINGGCITMVCTGTGGASSTGGPSGTGGSSSTAGLHGACVNGSCSALLLTPVSYYGVAGSAGPQFCSCEISCKSTACPSNMKCTSIVDGPSNICAYTDSAGNVIWP